MCLSTLLLRMLGKKLLGGILATFLFTQTALAEDSSFTHSISGQGKDIILIPGLMSDGRVWGKTAEALSAKYRVHIINIAGFGATPASQSNTLDKVKADLGDYLSNLENPIIIGHSLGGFLALTLAIDMPDAIGGVISVDGLPFIGPIFTRNSDTKVSDILPQANYIKDHYARLSKRQLRKELSQGIFIQARSNEARSVVLDMSSTSDAKTVGNMMYQLMTNDLRPSLYKIRADVLLLGASGALPNDAAKNQTEALYAHQIKSLPSANLKMNRESHHFIMLDEFDWFLQQVNNFLGEL